MENEFKQIENTLNRLYYLQTNHLDAFDKNELPDLEKQSRERSREVDTLMRRITGFIKTAEKTNNTNTESMLVSLNNQITSLLEQNRALETKVKTFRDEIKNSMKRVSKGKQVIGSYKSSASALNNPKAISLTN